MSAALPRVVDAWRMVTAQRLFEGWLEFSAMPRLAAALASSEGRCRYALEFGRDALGHGFLDVRAEAALPLICQRSLERFDLPVQVHQRLGMITDEAQEAGLPEGYEPVLLDAEGNVRPLDLIEDELLLALPAVPVRPDSESVDMIWPPEAPVEEPQVSAFAALAQLKHPKA